MLSRDVIRRIAGSSAAAQRREAPFLAHGSTRGDLLRYMRQHSYRHIFGDARECAPLLALLERVRLPRAVLDILGFFRRNDRYTYRHILIVTALTGLFAQSMGKDLRDAFLESSAGPLHDLGKISVPLKILRKTKPLLRTERDWLEHHTTAGYVLLAYYLGKPAALPCVVARDHHERRDGSGYPRGIPLAEPLVEIVVACDVYDALISPRPYRTQSFDNRTAIEEITSMAEAGKIGWDVVRFLVSRNREHRPPLEECTVSLEKRGRPPKGNLYGVILDEDPPA
ncbi:MAG TPA: HD domain-containing phosphohydrolase [Candidatus Aquicultoraceae bacterium]|nr:HD domain-containing phosphohydrolase [Candidatus Aquicultoraceae bacterium]